MKTVLSSRMSALFVTVYMLGTLFLRFLIEPQLGGAIWISVALGGFGLVFLWALGRARFLNFEFLFGPKNEQEAGT